MIVYCIHNEWEDMIEKEIKGLQIIYGRPVTTAEAIKSLNIANKEKYNAECQQPFKEFKGFNTDKFGCSECAEMLKTYSIIFMCPQHGETVICKACYEWMIEMQIYKQITSNSLPLI